MQSGRETKLRMTTAFASIVVLKLCLLLGIFSPVFMMRGADKAATRKAKDTKHKTTTAKRGKSVRREAGKKKSVASRSKAKVKKPRPLSVENQRKVDAYFIGRDFPNWKSGSQVPE